jgi:hypothetical protein
MVHQDNLWSVDRRRHRQAWYEANVSVGKVATDTEKEVLEVGDVPTLIEQVADRFYGT